VVARLTHHAHQSSFDGAVVSCCGVVSRWDMAGHLSQDISASGHALLGALVIRSICRTLRLANVGWACMMRRASATYPVTRIILSSVVSLPTALQTLTHNTYGRSSRAKCWLFEAHAPRRVLGPQRRHHCAPSSVPVLPMDTSAPMHLELQAQMAEGDHNKKVRGVVDCRCHTLTQRRAGRVKLVPTVSLRIV
jgi:hypothetical protein